MRSGALRYLRWADVSLIVVLMGAALRVWRWSLDRPLWLDEENISLNIRDRGFLDLFGQLDNHQSAPVGWMWSVRAAVEIFGSGDRILRLVPLLFAIATLVVAWAIGRRWLGPVGATALVALFAVGPTMLRYSTEVKQYSADVFWVLLLLGVAGVVVERADSTTRPLLAWWGIAAVAALFSMASMLVVPGLAITLLAVVVRRRGWRGALPTAAAGLGWLATCGLLYAFSLRYTVGDPYLVSYWDKFGFPPRSGGWSGAASWLAGQPFLIARDALGFRPDHAEIVCLVAAAGVLIAGWRRIPFALLLAAPVASGLALALAHVVPLAGRLSLWLAPSFLIALSVALDAPARTAWHLWRADRPGPLAARARAARTLALATLAVATVISATLYVQAIRPHLRIAAAPPPLLGGAHDRSAIAWIVANRRPGDIVLISFEASSAWHWYAGPTPPRPFMYFRSDDSAGCRSDGLARSVQGQRRVLAYARRFPGEPEIADATFNAHISSAGTIVESRRFGNAKGVGMVYVVDLHDSATEKPAGAPSPSQQPCLALMP